MVINPQDVTSYTTQYQEAFQKYLENKNCVKHRHEPVNNHKCRPITHFIPIAPAAKSVQLSFDPYYSSSIDEVYLMPNIVAEMKLEQSNCAACLLTTARQYLIALHEAPTKWGQIDPNLNHSHSAPMEIRRAFCIPDISDWWHQ
jgi:hypothetical protein